MTASHLMFQDENLERRTLVQKCATASFDIVSRYFVSELYNISVYFQRVDDGNTEKHWKGI